MGDPGKNGAHKTGRSSNGRTMPFGGICLGSNPSRPARFRFITPGTQPMPTSVEVLFKMDTGTLTVTAEDKKPGEPSPEKQDAGAPKGGAGDGAKGKDGKSNPAPE